jgi:ornithine cyclodeaminase/alanine dehydrogenase-like protein (mu-crystallin family)
MSVRLLDGADVDALATPELALAAARRTASLVAAGGVTTGRVQVGDEVAWLRVLAGLIPGLDLLGFKEFHRVGKIVHYHVLLFRESTGEALGIVDGRRITSLRTAATAALAFEHLFGARPVKLAVIGSGEEAREGLRATAAAVSVRRARVYSPTVENRRRLAVDLGPELGIDVEPVASVPEAVDGANAAYVATAATSPVIGQHDAAQLELVAAIGATQRIHNELSAELVARAREVVIDCRDAAADAGEMREAAEQHAWDPADAVLLGSWLERPATDGDGFTLFKSIGSVEQDFALALALLEAAAERGLGRLIDPVASVRRMR